MLIKPLSEAVPLSKQEIHGVVSTEDLRKLLKDAEMRFLQVYEIFAILSNVVYLEVQDNQVKTPPSGALFLYQRSKTRFRDDGLIWKKKKDGKLVQESHKKLKLMGVERVQEYSVRGLDDPFLCRRIYWLLGEDDMGYALVHYLNKCESTIHHASRAWEDVQMWYSAFPPFQQKRIDSMGFGHFLRTPPMPLRPSLILSAAERFCGFAMVTNVGELLPDLESMVRLTGLRVHGDVVTGRSQTDYRSQIKNIFGCLPPDSSSSLIVLKSEWLQEIGRPNFQLVETVYPPSHMIPAEQTLIREAIAERQLRIDNMEMAIEPGVIADRQLASFLAVFWSNCLFFSENKSLDCLYLQFLEKLDSVGDYAWGTAALAYLLDNMRTFGENCASHAGISIASIRGFLPFFQFWLFEHFNMCRPWPSLVKEHQFPGGLRWVYSGEVQTELHLPFSFYRDLFQQLSEDNVIWCPYSENDDSDIQEIHSGRQFFDVEGWICVFHIFAYYQPGRAARQFGLPQGVPDPAIVDRTSLPLFGCRDNSKVLDFSSIYQRQIKGWVEKERRALSNPSEESRRQYKKWLLGTFPHILHHDGDISTGEPQGESHDYHALSTALQPMSAATLRQGVCEEVSQGAREEQPMSAAALRQGACEEVSQGACEEMKLLKSHIAYLMPRLEEKEKRISELEKEMEITRKLALEKDKLINVQASEIKRNKFVVEKAEADIKEYDAKISDWAAASHDARVMGLEAELRHVRQQLVEEKKVTNRIYEWLTSLRTGPGAEKAP